MKGKGIYSLPVILFVAATGCMYPPKKFTEKRLVIPGMQTVRVEELDISITNGGCGKEWITDSDPPYEKPYCNLVVKTKDSTWHFGSSFDPLYIKNLKLVIDKINDRTSNEDSVPPGGCRIIITKLDDLSR